MGGAVATAVVVAGAINGQQAETSRAKTGRKAINIDEKKLC